MRTSRMTVSTEVESRSRTTLMATAGGPPGAAVGEWQAASSTLAAPSNQAARERVRHMGRSSHQNGLRSGRPRYGARAVPASGAGNTARGEHQLFELLAVSSSWGVAAAALPASRAGDEGAERPSPLPRLSRTA